MVVRNPDIISTDKPYFHYVSPFLDEDQTLET